MDTVTGVLLVTAPLATLALMGITEAPASPEFLSWVGVFVLAIGLSYFLVGGIPRTEAAAAGWRMQWKITALARFAVAAFVVTKFATGDLELAWLSVAATDAVVAVLQVIGLRAPIWKGGPSA
jgi:hypothetical protein